MQAIAVVGAFDTKGEEYAYLVQQIRARNHPVLVIDTSVLGEGDPGADIQPDRIAKAGGSSLEHLRQKADRGMALQVMAAGTVKVVDGLFAAGKISGIVGMGGSGGTSLFSTAVRNLPIGFPKVLVTTMASGDTRSIVGTRDLVLFPAVVDVAGLNRISRRIIANAANALCGMVEAGSDSVVEEKPIIAATMLGNTVPAIEAARPILEAAGYEVLVFHTVGTGGRTMESLIGDGLIAGVFDLTTTELASELIASPFSAGPLRLRAAGQKCLPQLISVGCLDFSIFGPRTSIPGQYQNRKLLTWSAETTIMRMTAEESAILGKRFAQRVNESRGPVEVILPLQGISLVDAPDQPFWDPEADLALFGAIRSDLRSDIPLIEVDAHINDPVFAKRAAEILLELLAGRRV